MMSACTVQCSVYCTKIPSSTQEAMTGITYCPGTEVELSKYFHLEYKGSSSRSWPVQYQLSAGRVKEGVSIPRVEVRDVSLEQDDHEEVSKKEEDEVLVEYKESWSTGLEEVRSVWRSREEEI